MGEPAVVISRGEWRRCPWAGHEISLAVRVQRGGKFEERFRRGAVRAALGRVERRRNGRGTGRDGRLTASAIGSTTVQGGDGRLDGRGRQGRLRAASSRQQARRSDATKGVDDALGTAIAHDYDTAAGAGAVRTTRAKLTRRSRLADGTGVEVAELAESRRRAHRRRVVRRRRHGEKRQGCEAAHMCSGARAHKFAHRCAPVV